MIVSTLVTAFQLYWLGGFLFSLWFVTRAAGRLDPGAMEGSLGLRLLLIPGAAALWPYLAWRLRGGGPAPREERNAHRIATRREPR